MSVKRLILILLLFPFISRAQTTTISGKITTNVSHTGIGKVSVFLSNSSFGTETADDGTFRLAGVKPGQYTLVASSIGFQEYTQSVLVGNEPINLDITLNPKVTQLRGVVISSEADWKRNYEMFRKQFIGDDDNAKKCDVKNPHELNLIYHGKKLQLEAWTNDFLVIENKALGYRVKFLVDTFSSSGIQDITQWQGQVVFQELPGSVSQKKAWKQKRAETYYGSSRHFLRSLYKNTLGQEGFIVYKLTRELNPDRPDEGVILHNIKKFQQSFYRDSLNYWISKQNMSRYYHENLIRQPLQPYQVCATTSQPGIFLLHFTDCLYVIYTRRHEETDFKDLYRPLDMENFETSILTLHGPYAVFDMNGVIFKDVPLSEGTWSKSKIADLLPFNYSPEDDK
ncbi:carboxypeptidase-like regulatory domain-containing protein [Mucilaginibacter ginsenosidivorans]|uniref:Carboxypeptidase-like regulatory domain-containing protein n=1 Tax=Mucilaginibacter ginsenosidivorans TaxID=398053 RepID=A0A5B8UY36_9SPHI|nr:carboxypeptidase-like regulatory domain-containing protein [Mucilaginibacter ginsenosidivorans]QEC63984.1 carboxypeptidase-like regulatory domain-containing protein [Mucilaginibacter ginsenosidivorans]